MAGSSSAQGAAAQSLQPDLWAKQLLITAYHGLGLIYVSAVCENLGPGAAHGPFSIAVSVDVRNAADNSLRESIVENFQVPADVILAGGPPVFSPELARPQSEFDVAAAPIRVGTPFQTQYVTGQMSVPLYFRDTYPQTVYTAEFLVDPYYEVPDHNRVNNTYAWPDRFWFLSLEARERQGPVVIKRDSTTGAP
jgi:hypothetical protein